MTKTQIRRLLIQCFYIFNALLLISFMGCKDSSNTPELNDIKKALSEDFGGEWKIENLSFGECLTLVKLPETMKMGSFIICSRTIKDINDKLINANVSAPFHIVGYSRNYQILTWLDSDDDNVIKLINIIRRNDS